MTKKVKGFTCWLNREEKKMNGEEDLDLDIEGRYKG